MGVSTRAGSTMGSPAYMSPEQWRDSASVDARTDIYALGVLTYQALTGRAPFTGPRSEELKAAHLVQPVPALGSGFPPELDPVMSRAMAKDRADRYDTALQFAAALREAAGLTSTPRAIAQLDPEIADRWVQTGPSPLAECVAALGAADDPIHARELVDQVVEVACRSVGLLALACRARIGTRRDDGAEVAELVRALRRGGLPARGWLELARALARPFAARRDLYPIPELVGLFFPYDGAPAFLDGEVATRLVRQDGGESAARSAGRDRRLRDGLDDRPAFLAARTFLLPHPSGAAASGATIG
jgi:hypothetical protein